MNKGHINLKCSDWLDNVDSSFKTHLESDLFADVTLVSDDKKLFQAHKLILSAGSEYFRDILSANTHPHPMLCLDGVSSDHLNWIIKYLYVGEVSVPQSRLQKFLKVSNKFKCFGLNEEEPQGSSQREENQEKFGISDISLENKEVPEDKIKSFEVVEEEHEASQREESDKLYGEYETSQIIIKDEVAPEPVENMTEEIGKDDLENEMIEIFDEKDHEQVHKDYVTCHEKLEEGGRKELRSDVPESKIENDEKDLLGDKALLVQNEEADIMNDNKSQKQISIKTDLEINSDEKEENLQIVKKNKIYPDFCRVAGKTVSADYLKTRLKEQFCHKEDGLFSCHHCEGVAKSQYRMMQHVQTHLNNLEFDCDICGKILQNTNSYRRHKYKHNQPQKQDKDLVQKCNYCGKQIKKKYIKSHFKENHDHSAKILTCSECTYVTKRKGSLKDHIESKHMTIAQYTCSECEYKTIGRNQMRYHKVNYHSSI